MRPGETMPFHAIKAFCPMCRVEEQRPPRGGGRPGSGGVCQYEDPTPVKDGGAVGAGLLDSSSMTKPKPIILKEHLFEGRSGEELDKKHRVFSNFSCYRKKFVTW